MCRTSCINLCASSHKWLRFFVILLYVLFVIFGLPWLITNIFNNDLKKKQKLNIIGGLFVITTLPICFWHIMQHVRNFTKPSLQKPIIRILWMVPIYSVNACVGLIYPEYSFYIDSIRECYEAYVIYNFMTYLLNFLNLEMDLEATLEYKPPVKHVFPLCCLPPWVMGREFVHNCKHGVLQYTVIRPILTIVSIICNWKDKYGEGTFSPDVAFPYIVAINNVSQFTAMYCLVLFYQANKNELRPMKPLSKFLCIKAVVFFSYFQSVIIYFLVYFEYIKNIFDDSIPYDYNILSTELQNFLICFEMFIAALAHKYSFPHDPYHINIPDYGQDRSWYSALKALIDLTDVSQDVTEHLGVVGSSLSRRLRGRTAYQMTRGRSETVYLMGNSMTSSGMSSSQIGYQGYEQSDSDASTSGLHKNHYGSVEAIPTNDTKNDAINIIKNSQNARDYSPQYGVPKIVGNYFTHKQQPTVHQQPLSSSSPSHFGKSETTTSKSEQGESSGVHCSVRKSDSDTSDWLSTPTDAFMGIDIKGREKDRINFNNDALT